MKRITIISGHYGSGKTNIAINLALSIAKSHKNIALADLDIVNPYFRSKDSENLLAQSGVSLVCSSYANTNVDIPALPPEMYSITHDKTKTFVVDLGGDDRGALVLGRLAQDIKAENNYDMLCVINKSRPETQDVESTIEIMREIERASEIEFTGLINNSNLGSQTTLDTVISSAVYANKISEESGIPLVMTTVTEEIYEKLNGDLLNLFPIKLQEKLY